MLDVAGDDGIAVEAVDARSNLGELAVLAALDVGHLLGGGRAGRRGGPPRGRNHEPGGSIRRGAST